jgi:preprotein translocase subunit SecG
MLLLIGFLTVAMVLICLFLILLVLMQLPKKDAGAGLAFGGAATDALFGSGSGNFLTKATKYSAVGFFCLAILLSVLQNHYSHRNISQFQEELKQPQNQPAMPAPAPAPRATAPAVAEVPTTNLSLTVPASVSNAAPASKP